MGVTLQHDTFKLGTPIVLKVTIKNVALRPVWIHVTGPEHDYELTVVDDSGKEPSRTDFGKSLLDERSGSAMQMPLQPQEEKQVGIDVTKIYQLTKPGVYIVRLGRVVLPDPAENQNAFVERTYAWPIAFKIVE